MKRRGALWAIALATGTVLMSGPAVAVPQVAVARVVGPASKAGLSTGASKTAFGLDLGANAACPGDSANDGYRVQSYMVPATVDPAILRFGSSGPLPTATGSAFRQPLYATTSSPFVNAQTANTEMPGDVAAIVGLPSFDLGVFAAGDVPPGDYNIGVACTKGSALDTVVARLWNTVVAIVADPSDTPAGIRWAVVANGNPSFGASASSAISSTNSDVTVGTGGLDSAMVASAASSTSREVRGSGSETFGKPSGMPPSFGTPALGALADADARGPWLIAVALGIVALVARLAFLSFRTSRHGPVAS